MIDNNENNKTYCYRHHNKETRIKCTECGNYICTSCIIQAPVGQKCPDCVASRTTHLEQISTQQYVIASLVAFTAAFVLSYVLYQISFGGLFSAILAYGVGYLTCLFIQKSIGMKIGFRIQAIAGVAVFVGLFYNPIEVYIDFANSNYQLSLLFADLKSPFYEFMALSDGDFSIIWKLLIVCLGIWASVRHFRL
ncbi:MAG: zinc finger, RING-type domain-containing protein [Cyanobacteriota bacterium]